MAAGGRREGMMQSGLYRFCDVSKWQSDMDWPRAARVLDFAYAKGSQGAWIDPQWENNYSSCKALGFPLGMYHYYDFTISRAAQSTYFKAMIDAYPTGLLPAIDLETQRVAPKMADLLNFIADIADHVGALPIIYTGPSFIMQYLSPYHELSTFPLWIAQYSTDKRWPLNAPRIPLPWFSLDFWGWQFSADGNNQGKFYGAQSSAIDLNVAWSIPRMP